MDVNYLLKLHRKASRYATRLGYDYLAEDFAQHIVLCRLEGRGLKQYLGQSFVDFMRQMYGRKGTPKQKDKYLERRFYSPLDFRGQDMVPEFELKDDYTRCLNRDQKAIFIDYFVLGKDLIEMGKKRNVTNSRMCQKVKNVVEVIKRALRHGKIKFI